jgi:hypothetical protein
MCPVYASSFALPTAHRHVSLPAVISTMMRQSGASLDARGPGELGDCAPIDLPGKREIQVENTIPKAALPAS